MSPILLIAPQGEPKCLCSCPNPSAHPTQKQSDLLPSAPDGDRKHLREGGRRTQQPVHSVLLLLISWAGSQNHSFNHPKIHKSWSSGPSRVLAVNL